MKKSQVFLRIIPSVFSILIIFGASAGCFMSCSALSVLVNNSSIVDILMDVHPHLGSKSPFPHVVNVEFFVINAADSTSAGSGNLVYDEASGKYRGSIAVESTGTLVFIGLAKDTEGRVLYFGNGSVTVLPSSSPSVTIMTETTGVSGSALGKRGPAGGYIFFAASEYLEVGGYSFRFLEAALEDAQDPLRWGARGSIGSSARSDGIGYGRTNTQAIITALGESDAYAGGYCGALGQNNFVDWYLPSKGEVALMYSNLKAQNLGGFSEAWYWSSTETGQNYANELNFFNGESSDYADKLTISSRVRATRYF